MDKSLNFLLVDDCNQRKTLILMQQQYLCDSKYKILPHINTLIVGVFGDPDVGKTAFIMNFCDNQGFNTSVVVNDKKLNVIFKEYV